MHDLDRNSSKYAVASIGVVASLFMLMVSAYLNAVWMYRLGKTPMDGYVYASAGVAIDVMMAVCPFLFFASFRNREFFRGVFTLILWVALTAFSAQSAIGHLAGSRSDAASTREVAGDIYKNTQTDLNKKRERQSWLPRPTEAAESLRVKLKGQQSQVLWAQTSECANQWNTLTKQFCAKVTELTSLLTNAIEYEKLDGEIKTLQNKLEDIGTHNTGVKAESDAGAGTISKLLGTSVKDTQSLLNMLGALVLLLGAGLGPYVSMATVQKMDRKIDAMANIVGGQLTPVVEDPPRLMIEQETAQPAPATAPAPARPVSGLIAPPISDEAKELLLAIGMPNKPCDKRPADKDEVLGYRFLAYLVANNYTGDFTPDQIDSLYNVYTIQDNRTPHAAMRIVKNRLEQTGPRFVKKDPNATRDDGSRGAVWTIKKVSIPVLSAVLMKRGIIPDTSLPPAEPEAVAPQPQNVYPLFSKGEAANG